MILCIPVRFLLFLIRAPLSLKEYGITTEEKLDISKQVCNRLLRKIRADLKHTVENDEIVHRLDPRYILF